MKRAIRLIAFYLPQYYPIPENDAWWGEGFTEWTNVKKARPLFRGHDQPHIPGNLGYYDLRDPDAREAQALLAKDYGIEGFCYWHYWFGDGKRLLETPFNEVLTSGRPDLPFCLGWANDSWTGIWHGAPGRTLIEQTYPGRDDEKSHFAALLDAFKDPRYITIDRRPVFYIYKPDFLQNSPYFIKHWNEMARKEGLGGIYFVANAETLDFDYRGSGFDAMTHHNPGLTFREGLGLFRSPTSMIHRAILTMTGTSIKKLLPHFLGRPYIYTYEEYVKRSVPKTWHEGTVFPTVVPNWDNTPRCGLEGVVLHGSTPDLFRTHIQEAVRIVEHYEPSKRIIFIKSWNEWAEGNYLEPDQKFGHEYLKVCLEIAGYEHKQ